MAGGRSSEKKKGCERKTSSKEGVVGFQKTQKTTGGCSMQGGKRGGMIPTKREKGRNESVNEIASLSVRKSPAHVGQGRKSRGEKKKGWGGQLEP